MKSASYCLAPLLLYTATLFLFGPDVEISTNPDFVSYYRIAEYWADGNTSLAISGYWGPLSSWLLAPFVRLGIDPAALGWYGVYASGVIFIIACGLFARHALQVFKYQFAAVLGCALWAAHWSGNFPSPDLLLSAVVILGLLALISAYQKISLVLASTAGLLFGLAYLVKTPGILFGVGMIIGYPVLFLLSSETTWQQVRRLTGASLVAMFLVSAPWIVTLTVHYEEFTWTKAAERNRQINTDADHPNFSTFHVPRDGRTHSWEDPTELGAAVGARPFTVTKILKRVLRNTVAISEKLLNPLWFLLVVGSIVALVIHPGERPRFLNSPWRLGLAGSAVIIAPHLVAHGATGRYFIVCYPLMLIASLGCIDWAERSGLLSWRIETKSRKIAPAKAVLVLFMITLWIPMIFKIHLVQAERPKWYGLAKTIATELRSNGFSGPIAEIGRSNLAFYAAVHLGTQFHGRERTGENLKVLSAQGTKFLIVSEKQDHPIVPGPGLREISNILHSASPELSDKGIRFFVLAASN